MNMLPTLLSDIRVHGYMHNESSFSSEAPGFPCPPILRCWRRQDTAS